MNNEDRKDKLFGQVVQMCLTKLDNDTVRDKIKGVFGKYIFDSCKVYGTVILALLILIFAGQMTLIYLAILKKKT